MIIATMGVGRTEGQQFSAVSQEMIRRGVSRLPAGAVELRRSMERAAARSPSFRAAGGAFRFVSCFVPFEFERLIIVSSPGYANVTFPFDSSRVGAAAACMRHVPGYFSGRIHSRSLD